MCLSDIEAICLFHRHIMIYTLRTNANRAHCSRKSNTTTSGIVADVFTKLVGQSNGFVFYSNI